LRQIELLWKFHILELAYGFSMDSIKKGPKRAFLVSRSGARLLAEASRRDVTAVSTDDSAGYGIIVAGSGSKAAKASGNESAGDLLHFLFIQSAGAHPA
jgi:hypothetical protein